MISIFRAIGTKIDHTFLDQLAQEGIVYDSKKVWLTITGSNVRTPRFICGISKALTRGQLIKTKKRLAALAGNYKLIDIPLKHPLYQEIIINRTEPKRFIITFDLSKFPTNYSGNIKLSFRLNPNDVLI